MTSATVDGIITALKTVSTTATGVFDLITGAAITNLPMYRTGGGTTPYIVQAAARVVFGALDQFFRLGTGNHASIPGNNLFTIRQYFSPFN